MSGQFGGTGGGGECAYMLTYRRQSPTPSESPTLPAVPIPPTPLLETPTIGGGNDAVILPAAAAPETYSVQGLVGASLRPPAATHPGEKDGERSGWREEGAAVSDTREAPNSAAAAYLPEFVAEERDGGLGRRSRGGSVEGVEKGEMDGKLKLPRTMLATPLPLHLQILVREANEELRRWEGWCGVKYLFYVHCCCYVYM